MKFSRDEIAAQGADYESRSMYLSGFSYAAVLSATELMTHRYRWSEMTDSEWDETDAAVSRMIAEIQVNMMIGVIIPYIGETIPEYLLLCDGASYAREDYPDLYDSLPVALIIDSDNFNVPNLAGLTVFGTSAGLPHLSQGGEAEHTLTESEMPSHSHTYTPPTINIDVEAPGVPDPVAAGIGLPTATGSAGGDQPHNNMPPYIALNYCIIAL